MKKSNLIRAFFALSFSVLTISNAFTTRSFAATSQSNVVSSEIKYEFEQEVTSYTDLAILSHVLDEYLIAHPGAPEFKQEVYIKSFVEKWWIKKFSRRLRLTTNGDGLIK